MHDHSYHNMHKNLQTTVSHNKTKLAKKEDTPVTETIEMKHLNLPLVEPPQTFTCDGSGKRYTIEGHDISVSIPPGAVAKGSLATITTGILLSGPFIFHAQQSFVPVSPILHLSMRGKVQIGLKKPITLTFPHFLDQASQHLQNLAIFRAPYSDSAASIELTESEASQLQIGANGKIISEVVEGAGYFCIAHKSPEKLKQASLRYYLHTVEKNDVGNTHTLHFFVTYALNTFHRVRGKAKNCFKLVTLTLPYTDNQKAVLHVECNYKEARD